MNRLQIGLRNVIGIDDRERNAELLQHRRDVVADAWDVRDVQLRRQTSTSAALIVSVDGR